MVQPVVVYAALALGALACTASFSAGWSVRGWREGAKEQAAQAELQQARQDAVRRVELQAVAYERGRAEAAARGAVVEKEVIRVVSKPVYLERCLDDDGLRLVDADIAAANARRGLAPELPPSAPDR